MSISKNIQIITDLCEQHELFVVLVIVNFSAPLNCEMDKKRIKRTYAGLITFLVRI